MSMIDTRKDMHAKSAGAFIHSWLKVDEQIAAGVPMVLWKEITGSLLVILGAAAGAAVAVFAGMQMTGIWAFVVWLVVSLVACTVGVLPGKALLKGTRCRVAAILILWLIPVLVVGAIVTGVMWAM